MKKFNFKLGTVLKLKEKVLNDKMLELARVTKLLSDAKKNLDMLNNDKSNTSSNIMREYAPGEEVNVSFLTVYRNYIGQLISRIKTQEQLIQQINMALREKQKEVREALKEKDILEKLKEKQLAKHYKEIDHKERVELDDIALSRYKAS